ncbi:MAG TPA: hypothetical protein VHW01_10525 [Polyangiaceae bacterium]|jgi:hypothetical protein|nr:hypothetical protein [Polyangiaceae bacterium]
MKRARSSWLPLLRGLSLLALASVWAVACGGPQNPGGPGSVCFRADDCKDGLTCVPSAKGSSKSICSSDLSGIVSMVDGAPPTEAGTPQGDAAMGDAGAAPTGGSGNAGTGGNSNAGTGGTGAGGKPATGGASGAAGSSIGKAGASGNAGMSAGGTASGGTSTGGSGTAGSGGDTAGSSNGGSAPMDAGDG